MKFFTSPQDTWDHMYQDIAAAKKSILFEQFIFEDFENDEVGQRFANLFIQKAHEGVQVKLLLDIFGSHRLFFSPTKKTLRDAGVQIHFTAIYLRHFLTFSFWKTRRNHRKLTIIDDTTAYIGGVIFTENVSTWYDFHARIHSPSQIFTHAFFLSKKSKFAGRLLRDTALEDEPYNVVTNDFKNNHISQGIYEKIISSEKSITIITPYFAPPERFVNALLSASERGVLVQIIFPENTDNYFALSAHYYYIYRLRNSNIEFKAFTKMNHSKVIMIDNWITFGSCNFDYLSLKYNKELNITTSDTQLIKEIREILTPIIKETIPVAESHILNSAMIFKMKRIFIGSFARFFV